jgi:hypothetical protein
VESLPGVGHMGPITHAEQVNARIARQLLDSSTLPIAA